MAKKKVHELAKEIGADKKILVEYLAGKGYDQMTAVSLVPEGEIENIRSRFGTVAPKAEAKPAVKPADAGEKTAESGDASKKTDPGMIVLVRSGNASKTYPQKAKPAPGGKKKGIPSIVTPVQSRKVEVTVVNPLKPAQPKNEEKPAVQAPQETAPAAPRAEEIKTPAAPAPAPMAEETKKAAPAEESKAAPKAPAAPASAAPAAAAPAPAAPAPAPQAPAAQPARRESAPVGGNARPQEDGRNAGRREQGGDRTGDRGGYSQNRPQGDRTGDRGGYSQNRPQGDRGSYGNRPQGDRTGDRGGYSQNRPQGDRGSYGNRPQGDRTGDRGGYSQNRPQGDRGSYGNRPQGDRGSYGNRPQGDRTGGYGQNRPQGDRTGGYSQNRPQGDRTGTYGQNRPQGDRTGGYGQNRPQGDRTGSYGNRPQSGDNRGFGGNRPQGGFGGNRTQGSARPADTDGALVKKTTRDYKKDGGKEYDRAREDRRENGRHGQFDTQNAGSKKTFNRVPRALQNNQPRNNEKPKQEAVTELKLPEKITVRDLAEKMKLAPAALVKELFMKGEMVTLNHEISYEKAEEICLEHEIIVEPEEKEDIIGALLAEAEESEEDMVTRPPVVCVMGHVDHGKTSLLDAIRDTHVTAREAGGITQHIGAYMVTVNGEKITFLDTPGHEAFTAMRMRGANSTDIAVLVVAADDGVMPQTIEAINHAKAAGVEIIVAINKIDKPGANVERVKQELTEYGLVAEDWGGSTVFCPVSAKTHEGIDNLLEMILLTAEVAELKANPNRKARGLVLEAKLDKGRGPVATILIQKGTLHQGDFIACGSASGKVRAMTDENGKRLQKATPSMPVEIIGLSSVPGAGEVLVSLDSDKEAKAFAQTFIAEDKKTLIESTKTQMSLEDVFNQIKEGSLKELPLVVKADVQGSVEAVRQSLVKLSNEEVVVKVIHGGVGTITESDVALASASNAVIIGFNVRIDATAKSIADTQKVDVHLYNVIYEAIEDVERAIKGMRAAVYEEKVLGHAEIRQIFKSSKTGNIAGSYVKDGTFQRNCKIRVFRGSEKLYEGQLESLKRFKDDVKEVREGFECGLVFKDWGDFAVEDTVEAYTMVEVPRE